MTKWFRFPNILRHCLFKLFSIPPDNYLIKVGFSLIIHFNVVVLILKIFEAEKVELSKPIIALIVKEVLEEYYCIAEEVLSRGILKLV